MCWDKNHKSAHFSMDLVALANFWYEIYISSIMEGMKISYQKFA